MAARNAPTPTPMVSVGRFIARSSPGSYLRLSHVMIRPSFSSTGFDSQMASMAGTKVSERMKAKTSAMMTVIAIGVKVLPSTPVSVSSGT